MKWSYHWLFGILSLLAGITFILSFYTKLFPVELFEIRLVEAGISGWKATPFLARVILGIELFTGLVFILNINAGRWFYLFSLLLLTLFTIHLLIQVLTEGNEGNCGCFSDFIPMTPLQAILKNFILMGIIFILYRYYKGIRIRSTKAIVVALALVTLALPFVLNPPGLQAMPEPYGRNSSLPLAELYTGSSDSIPHEDLRKGKWIIACLSLTCPHCKAAAYKMQVMKNKNPEIPIYFFLNGKEKHLGQFMEETHLASIPYTRLKAKQFIRIGGLSLPAIFLVDDETIYKKPDYTQLGQEEVEAWLAEGKASRFKESR